MRKQDKQELYRAFGLATSIGLNMAVMLGLGIWLGIQFDQWLDSTPLGAAVGIIVGMIAALWTTYKKVLNK